MTFFLHLILNLKNTKKKVESLLANFFWFMVQCSFCDTYMCLNFGAKIWIGLSMILAPKFTQIYMRRNMVHTVKQKIYIAKNNFTVVNFISNKTSPQLKVTQATKCLMLVFLLCCRSLSSLQILRSCSHFDQINQEAHWLDGSSWPSHKTPDSFDQYSSLNHFLVAGTYTIDRWSCHRR